jgi:hypothetical protein
MVVEFTDSHDITEILLKHTLVKIVTTMTLQPLSFINRVTRRVSLEKQEVPTLPEHLHSPLIFNGVFVARSLVFFGLTIALSALLRFTDSDYPLWDLQTLFNEHDVHKQNI